MIRLRDSRSDRAGYSVPQADFSSHSGPSARPLAGPVRLQ